MNNKNNRTVLIICSFLSGIAALIFQIIWIRYFSYLFGYAYLSVASIVTSFMFGLALGSLIFGKICDKVKNPLKLLFIIELGIGLYGLLFPFIFSLISKLFIILHTNLSLSLGQFNLIKFALSFVTLIIPTSLMGATLPVLSKIFNACVFKTDKSVGNIYYSNNLGATLGTLLCGFFLLYIFGLLGASSIASSLNFCVCLIVFFFLRKEKFNFLQNNTSSQSNQFLDTSLSRLVFISFVFAGFASLALEVLWTRILTSSALSCTIYSFSVVLISFILGLSLGSLIYTKWLFKIRRPIFSFGLVQILIGIFSIILTNALRINYNLASFLWREAPRTWIAQILIGSLTSLILILIPTTLMGLNLPLVSKILIKNNSDLGKRLGKILFLQTIACALGSFSAGFILIQTIGLQASIILISIISAIFGMVIIFHSPNFKFYKLIRNSLIIILILIIFTTPWKKQFNRNITAKKSRIIFYKEGPSVTVAVREVFDVNSGKFYKRLEVDGIFVAGTNPNMLTDQKILAHLPLLLLGRQAKNTLTVGFGSGATSYTMSLYDVEKINCVEINPNILEAAKHFKDINHNILQNPRYNLILDDARSFIQKGIVIGINFGILGKDFCCMRI